MLRKSSSHQYYRKTTSLENQALTHRQNKGHNIKLQNQTGRLSQSSIRNKIKQQELKRNQMEFHKDEHYRKKKQQRRTNSSLPNKSSLTSIPIQSNSSLITSIDYSHNKISTIQKDFPKFYASLTIINLSHNLVASMLPLCYCYDLKELILSFNLINLVPKQVKYLSNISVLDLSDNKLWYLNQVTALKQLVKIRTQDKKESIKISLQGNLVLKTNQKAIKKVICLNSINIHSKKQKNDPIIQFVNKKIEVEQNKQNILPNKMNIFSNSQINEPFTKTMRTKSLNQSLMDISSIMYNGQSTTNNFQFKPSDIPSNSEMKKKQFESKQNKVQSIQFIAPMKQNEQNQNSSQLLMSIQKFQNSDNRASKQQDVSLLFKKYMNFDKQFVFPAQKFIKELKQFQKKLKLCQKIQGVPQNLEKQFSSLNNDVLININTFLQLLLPFQNFFEHNIPALSINIQKYLKNLKGSELKIKNFHEATLQSYLNSDKCAEIKWYEVWIYQYELFEDKAILIQKLLNSFIQLWKKISKLQRVNSLLYQQRKTINDVGQGIQKKIVISKGIFSSKKQTQKKQLNNLLFSESKYKKTSLFCSQKKQSLLLSQKNSRSSVKQLPQYFQKYSQNTHDFNECLQCPIKNQQVLALNKIIQEYQQKNQLYQQRVIELQRKIQSIEKQTELNQKLSMQQTQIILQISQIKPSSYQNLLLTQAKTIESFINTQSFQPLDRKLKCLEKQLYMDPGKKNNEDRGQTCNFCGNSCNYKKYSKNQKQTNDQQFMDKQKSSSENEIIYTQISQQSKTKIKKSDRTYFKSNGTQPFNLSDEQTKAAQKGRQRTSASPINKMSTNKFSMTHEHLQEVKFSNPNKINFSQANKQSFSNNHNQPFQKIVIGEFVEDKTQENRNTKIRLTNIQRDKQVNNKNREKQIHLNSQVHNFQTHKFQNRIHQNCLSSQRTAQIDFSKNQNNTKISIKSNLNNNLRGLFQPEKQHFPFGYNYQNVQLDQKIEYQNYIKHHLRNNIRQILEKKNTLTLQNQKDLKISQLQEKFYKSKLCHLKRHFIDQECSQTITKKPRHKTIKSCSDLKGKSYPKYILKR